MIKSLLLSISLMLAAVSQADTGRNLVLRKGLTMYSSVATDGTVSAATTAVNIHGLLSGTSAGVYGPLFALINHDVSANTNSGGANQAFLLQENVPSTAGNGAKTGLTAILNFSGGPRGPVAGFYTPVFGQTYVNGGTPGVAYGDFYGGASLVQAQCNCNIEGLAGHEVDASLAPGTTAKYKYGLVVASVNGDAAHATPMRVPGGLSQAGTQTVQEAMLSFVRDASTRTGWDCGICFGQLNGYWPIDALNGTIIGVQPSYTISINGGLAAPVQAKDGIDLRAVTFTDAFLRSTGFTVGPKGYTSAQRYNAPLYTPPSSSAPCAAGDFADDDTYHYVCVASNKWKRVALSAF